MTKNQQKSSQKIFEQRRNTLRKKANTLSTLCNDVCLLCFGPTGDFASYPEDPSKVRAIIERFKEASRRTAQNKRFRKEKLSLSDVLSSKIKSLQKQLSDQEASNSDNDPLSLSLWDQKLDSMGSESLVALSGCLESKIQAIDSRIGFLNAQKNYQQRQANNGFFSVPSMGFVNGFSQQQVNNGFFSVPSQGFLNGISHQQPINGFHGLSHQFNGGHDSLWLQDQKLNLSFGY